MSAATMRRVMVTIPPAELQTVEEWARKLGRSRSALIREALAHYLEEQRRQEFRELLKEGYLVGAEESLRISEEFAYAEQEAWERYAPWEEPATPQATAPAIAPPWLRSREQLVALIRETVEQYVAERERPHQE